MAKSGDKDDDDKKRLPEPDEGDEDTSASRTEEEAGDESDDDEPESASAEQEGDEDESDEDEDEPEEDASDDASDEDDDASEEDDDASEEDDDDADDKDEDEDSTDGEDADGREEGEPKAAAGEIESAGDDAPEEGDEEEEDGEEEEGERLPAHLGAQKYVYSAFFTGSILFAYILGRTLETIWGRLAAWDTAVDAVPSLAVVADDDKVTYSLVAGGLIAVVVALRTFRKSTVRTWAEEVAAELVKVKWPTRKDVYGSTVVVLATSAIAVTYLFLLDRFWGFVTNLIYGTGT